MAAMKIRKCRSKKHSFGGCGDPKCPEGLSVQAALDTAMRDKNLNEFFAVREKHDIQPTHLGMDNGFARLWVQDNGQPLEAPLIFVAERPAIQAAVAKIDRSVVPSFGTVKAMEDHINNLYRPYAHVSLRQYDNVKLGVTRLSVADMKVDADLRGQGIGQWIRSTITKHCDEKGYIITGTPTNGGDGSMDQTNDNYEEYKAKALAHRQRLINFYLRNGYEYNYAVDNYDYMNRGDFWTKEPFPQNQEWVDKFNLEAQNFIAESGSYIRWPNGVIPKSMLAKKRSSSRS